MSGVLGGSGVLRIGKIVVNTMEATNVEVSNTLVTEHLDANNGVNSLASLQVGGYTLEDASGTLVISKDGVNDAPATNILSLTESSVNMHKDISGGAATLSGNLSGATATLSGALSAQSAALSGGLTAATLGATDSVSVAGVTTVDASGVSTTVVNATTVNATNISSSTHTHTEFHIHEADRLHIGSFELEDASGTFLINKENPDGTHTTLLEITE